ncbi:MAG TPA: aspartate-semialdehyde dehydrogenase [Vicinamibacterales bacterium]|nr:aspartate-semialdehyde dehydrogenase [Vicinamibacterales bacterium]
MSSNSNSWLPPSGGKIDVGILGATGVVGQQLVSMLAGHPWFRVTWLAASERSAGHRYGDLAWRLPARIPADTADLRVSPLDAISDAPQLLFSALDASVAGDAETAFARSGRHVVSNARNHRMDPLVPLLIPEVNPDHLSLLDAQRRARGWTGSLVTNPNCSTIVIAMVLAALRPFAPKRIIVTTMQALSGAGYPGVASLDALGNVVPYIGGGEEEKIETESLKLLGRYADGAVINADFVVSAQVNRVPVPDGHTAVMAFELAAKPSIDEVSAALANFTAEPQQRRLPTAPAQPIVLHTAQDRPQPRLDVAFGGGMPVHAGRVRRCPVLGYKLVAMGHNVVRGASGAALLNAELMVARLRSAAAAETEDEAKPFASVRQV